MGCKYKKQELVEYCTAYGNTHLKHIDCTLLDLELFRGSLGKNKDKTHLCTTCIHFKKEEEA